MFNNKSNNSKVTQKNPDYILNMSMAPKIGEGVHWFQLLPAIFFTACVVVITRMANYTRPMNDFYWSGMSNDIADFFSYYKMIAVIICAVLALVFIAYRVFSQSLQIKRHMIYIPMLVYAFFIIISYVFSEYKVFALLGYVDRFEGTLVLLSYLVMLFYIINSVNDEKSVKFIIYPLAFTSGLLGLLGVSQATDHDFFRTTLGQKLIAPNFTTASGETVWQLIDAAAEKGEQFFQFTFQNKEIYQTVYNINYVSFYLTLLIPVFGLLFIRAMESGKETALWKKIIWGLLFGLLIYNLIGSASSGGFLGMGVVVIAGIIILNKRIIKWWKPLVILVVITLAVSGITYERWLPEISYAFKMTIGYNTATLTENKSSDKNSSHIDYIYTEDDYIKFSLDGNSYTITTNRENPIDIKVKDSKGNKINYSPNPDNTYSFDGENLANCKFSIAQSEGGTNFIILLINNDSQWRFAMTQNGTMFLTDLNQMIYLKKAESIGFENKGTWGTGRGYIWSRSFPMLRDTIIKGYGADTYALYFPHYDYVGKYNSVEYKGNINIIVDKPHNMYLGMAIGTGLISLIAFLSMVLIYAVQSSRLYWRRNYVTFLDYTGLGIFLGLMGFLFTGIVDDSSVSIMPMFYGLWGIGIAINSNIKRQNLPTI